MKNLKIKRLLTMLSVILIVSFIVGIMALSFNEMKTQYAEKSNENKNVVNEYSSAINKATKDLSLSELPDGQVKVKIPKQASCVGCTHSHITTTAGFSAWIGDNNTYAVLDNDITLTGGYSELKAGKTLDGNGYLITLGGQIKPNDTQASSFIITNNGIIKNTNFTVGAVDFNHINRTNSYTGLLAVDNFGTIDNVKLTLTGRMYINNAGSNWAHQKAGGLVCVNKANAVIKNATLDFNGGNIYGITDANLTGNKSSVYIGGLAYINDESALVQNCTVINADIKTSGTASWHAGTYVSSYAAGIAYTNNGNINGIFFSKKSIDGVNSGKGASGETDSVSTGNSAEGFYSYSEGFSVQEGYSAYFDKSDSTNMLFAKNAPAEREIIYEVNGIKTYSQLSSIVSLSKAELANSAVSITKGTKASGYSFVDSNRQFNGSDLSKTNILNYDGRTNANALPINYYSDRACTELIGANAINAGTYYRKLTIDNNGLVYLDEANKIVVVADVDNLVNEVIISRRILNEYMAVLPNESDYNYVYDKTEKQPNVIITDMFGNQNLFSANDIESVTYANNITPTSLATATVVAKGNYEGSVQLGFSISKRVINFSNTSKTYDGNGGFLLTLGTEHNVIEGDIVTVSFTVDPSANSINLTSREYILSDIKNYSLGTIKVTINAKQLTEEMISIAQLESYVYNAKPKSPSVSVSDLNDTRDLISFDKDIASVEHINNVYAGNATVKITAKGNYIGVVEQNFEIVKKEVSIKFSGYDSLISNGNNRNIDATLIGLEGNDVVNAVISYYYPNMFDYLVDVNKFGNYVAKAVLPNGGIADSYILNQESIVEFEIKPIIVSLGNVNSFGDISLFVSDYLFDFNDIIVFAVYPNTGYDVNSIIIGENETSIQNTANYGKSVYVTVKSNASIEITYNEVELQLTYNASDGGTLTGEKSQTLLRGYDATAVTAVANDGYEFKRWSDGNANATRQDLRVGATKTLTAYFEEIEINAEKGTAFNVYVLGGGIITDIVNNISGADFSEFVLDGVKLTFKANASDGNIFVRWEKVSEVNGVLVYTTLTNSASLNVSGDSVTAKSIIRAVFAKADGSIEVSNTVNTNLINYDKLPIGYTRSINATFYEGFKFSHWEADGKILSTNTNINITVAGQLKIKAVYIENIYYQLTFLNRKNMPLAVVTSADNSVVLMGAPVEKDYNFIGWFDKNGNMFEVGSSLQLTESLTLTAKYEFVVDGRTFNKVEFIGEGNAKVEVAEFGTKEVDNVIQYQFNTYVIITADEFIENNTKKFAYWLNASGAIVSYSRQSKIYVLNNLVLKPVYVAVASVIEKQNSALVTISADYKDGTPTKIYFDSKLSLVEGYTKIEHGAIITSIENYANDESMQLNSPIKNKISDTNDFYLKQKSNAFNSETGQYRISLANSTTRILAKNQNWYARAYVRLVNLSNNQEIVVYSAITRFTL